MASSSNEDLDDSTPEIIYKYQLSVVNENSYKRDELWLARCWACNHIRRFFYCPDCVKNGDFTHSKKKCFERYADKKPKKYKLDAERNLIVQRYEEAFADRKRIENVKLEVFKCKEKIHLLRESISSSKDRISRGEKMIQDLKEKNMILLSDGSLMVDGLCKMRRQQRSKSGVFEFEEGNLNLVLSALQNVIQRRTQELVNHIFPITKFEPHDCRCSTEEGQYAELEEAQKTTYVHGQWVIARNPMDDVQYLVVKSRIPDSGDYSAYSIWCTEHIAELTLENLSTLSRPQFDVAYGVSSALAYTSQLVSILAFYLDAHVPKRCSFSDFCEHASSRTKFLHKVAKLNSNIISLCLSQQVDMSKISAHQTISNLLLLIDSVIKQPIRLPQLELKEELIESIESSVSKDLLPVDESDSDDLESEFVHVSGEEFFEVPDRTSVETTQVQASLVSSIFSLWKAATRPR